MVIVLKVLMRENGLCLSVLSIMISLMIFLSGAMKKGDRTYVRHRIKGISWGKAAIGIMLIAMINKILIDLFFLKSISLRLLYLRVLIMRKPRNIVKTRVILGRK